MDTNQAAGTEGTPRRHFHDEQAGLSRALGPLPFEASPQLSFLVRACYPPQDLADAAAASPNPYALQPDTLQFLAALLDRLSPSEIVEFGSGESTRLLAGWAGQHGARVLSVEHDRGWIGETRARLTPAEQSGLTLVHAPLRPVLRGVRQFLTYRHLMSLAPQVQRAGLLLVDGPHVSGREPVLYLVMGNSRPGAIIVVDDYRNYGVREILMGVPAEVAACFTAEPISENSHGLCILRCVRKAPAVRVPSLGAAAIVRSYWRCLRDLRDYGTGD